MKVSIEKQSDGSFIAYNTTGDFVTLLGTGATVEDAKSDFVTSFNVIKESYSSRGDFMPEELTEDIEFNFDVSSLFEYYSMFNVSALARYLGINESLMRQYKGGATYVSDKQIEKIESGMRKLGTELAALRIH
ncbi:MAG: hypothetical protein J1E38_06750 [Paramuribaculum sp.]|nr:hypothetical protein [Paramuribaculum sp.]